MKEFVEEIREWIKENKETISDSYGVREIIDVVPLMANLSRYKDRPCEECGHTNGQRCTNCGNCLCECAELIEAGCPNWVEASVCLHNWVSFIASKSKTDLTPTTYYSCTKCGEQKK